MPHLTAYACVYYNNQICNTNEVTPLLVTMQKTFMVSKAITLTQLVELVQQKDKH